MKQFSLFLENRVGKFLDIISLLKKHETHVLAVNVVDTSDSSIVRLVLDDPDRGRALFQEHYIPFIESDMLVVEMDAITDFETILNVLLQAEINIMYTYSFLGRPKGKPALAFSMDDPECAVHALLQHHFKILHQRDISR
ncbi:MAG: acetolactate synthase [Verrucomicrobiota bacterium]